MNIGSSFLLILVNSHYFYGTEWQNSYNFSFVRITEAIKYMKVQLTQGG